MIAYPVEITVLVPCPSSHQILATPLRQTINSQKIRQHYSLITFGCTVNSLRVLQQCSCVEICQTWSNLEIRPKILPHLPEMAGYLTCQNRQNICKNVLVFFYFTCNYL